MIYVNLDVAFASSRVRSFLVGAVQFPKRAHRAAARHMHVRVCAPPLAGASRQAQNGVRDVTVDHVLNGVLDNLSTRAARSRSLRIVDSNQCARSYIARRMMVGPVCTYVMVDRAG